MGSEHYCLRWNNHQSNLLGVFSQLLESESLVDVTLACTEGPSIRAHKVVLSACSSYFQALFLDHPNRHPIVILKDVRFAELRTLVDFMYKGEVNVEYCQLSALLKTAESLKVKGLADMTNINAAAAAGHASKDEQQQHHRSSPTTAPTSTTTATTTTTTTTSLTAAEAAMSTATATTTTTAAANNNDPTAATSPVEAMVQDGPEERPRPEPKEAKERNHERERDCRDRDRDRDRDRERDREKERERRETGSRERELRLGEAGLGDELDIGECRTSPTTTRAPASPCPGPLALDRPRSRRDSDSAASLEETRGSLSPLSVQSGPSDMSLGNNSLAVAGVTPVTMPIGGLPQSRLPSPHSTEPLAGPSGLPPVQQVPLVSIPSETREPRELRLERVATRARKRPHLNSSPVNNLHSRLIF
jgi:Tfp pilus assembly major pilin PilA